MSQAGKGDKRRPEDKKTSDANYDKIDWSKKADQTEHAAAMVDLFLTSEDALEMINVDIKKDEVG